ncbi:hypothetical protein RR42_m3750 [Cupriavidus basilensis]|uniref:Uncharacterized protein n=1 Tax=Cupriavidus basilensis TaxID=68895 RepID=A0A0C4YEC1_9BURK|nr:hypothetical protein RR42_m3750 [Cupriavidus basilensis]
MRLGDAQGSKHGLIRRISQFVIPPTIRLYQIGQQNEAVGQIANFFGA